MSTKVCLLANTLHYPEGGGHMCSQLGLGSALICLLCGRLGGQCDRLGARIE
jgi:hypothetical protein